MLVAKIAQLEQNFPISEDPIPEMTHNVFGLDHAVIMNRLLAARKKSKDAWSSLNEDSSIISYRARLSEEPEVDVGKQKRELAEFLLQRQILENRLRKQKRDTRECLEVSNDEETEVTEDYDDFDEDISQEYEDTYYEDLAEIEKSDQH